MKASLLVKGDAVFDSVREAPFAGFVAMAGNRIIGVGGKGEEAAYCGPGTVVYDAGERLVMPGFHDSHTHLILAGMYKGSVNLGAAHSEEEAARMLWEFEQAHPTEDWVYGFNWYHVFWDNKTLPTKFTLDKYFPDRPVFLVNAEAHGAWVNSKALELAGVTRDTPDPFGGEVARLENGDPSGFLYESAVAYVGALCLELSTQQQAHYLDAFMKSAAPLGITSVVDVQPYFGANLGSSTSYQILADAEKLSLRIHAAPDLLGDLDQAAADAALCNGDMVRCNIVKQFVDGVFTTHTALLLEDYTDAPGNKGTRLSPLEKIREAVGEAHRRGLSIKLHCLGDQAIRFALDCFEEAVRKYGMNAARHAIEHFELVDPADMARVKELGVIPSVQPEHLGLMPTWEGEEYRHVLGEERAARTWQFKTLLKEAGVLALGSDCPVVDNNPFLAIHRGMTRLHDDGLPEGGWSPEEKLTLAELLKAYTYGSAYGVSREGELGTLEPDKLADVVVIDRNLFEATPEEIRNAKIDLTIMDGKIIFNRNKQ